MKHIITAAAACLTLVASGCGGGDVSTTTSFPSVDTAALEKQMKPDLESHLSAESDTDVTVTSVDCLSEGWGQATCMVVASDDTEEIRQKIDVTIDPITGETMWIELG